MTRMYRVLKYKLNARADTIDKNNTMQNLHTLRFYAPITYVQYTVQACGYVLTFLTCLFVYILIFLRIALTDIDNFLIANTVSGHEFVKSSLIPFILTQKLMGGTNYQKDVRFFFRRTIFQCPKEFTRHSRQNCKLARLKLVGFLLLDCKSTPCYCRNCWSTPCFSPPTKLLVYSLWLQSQLN